MNKIRHIALSTKEPDKTAAFYKEAFGFAEVGRIGPAKPAEGDLYGVYLSDGTVNLAVINFGDQDQLGRGTDYVGLHHFGILTDDAETTGSELRALGAPCLADQPGQEAVPLYETKFVGPDGVVFDVAGVPWIGTPPLGG